jgi:molecular chaperone IbpA
MNTTLNALFPQLETLRTSLDPFTVGYDKMFVDLGDMTKDVIKKAQTYPPYNIKQINKNKYVIEMAVAGFAKTDIEVTLEGNKLVIKGSTIDSSEDKDNYIYKGIANRNFNRAFTLADKVEIKDAEITNGMLKVWLENMVKVQDAVKKITVKSKDE